MKLLNFLSFLINDKKVSEETGKALYNFANMLVVVVLLKSYWERDNILDFIIAFFAIIFLYLPAMMLIKYSRKDENV